MTAMITAEQLVGDVIAKYPETVKVMEQFGFHCFGCGANAFETIGEGAIGHGMSSDELELLLQQLNEVAAKKNDNAGAEGVVVTKEAAAKISELRDKAGVTDKELRIRVKPGGCAGLSYDFAFDAAAEDDDIIDAAGVKVYVDRKSMDFLKGATINYVETLQKSGFVVKNPNATSTCGCGSSFG